MRPLGGTDGTVMTDGRRMFTASTCPGKRVYGERLVSYEGVEYREWDPRRSKLSAYLTVGGKSFPFKKTDTVLYLGAASGTTASHVSDIVSEGRVYCVEFAPRSFRDLVHTCDSRPNMIPILGDATKPEEYSFIVESADVVYEDVAQKRQADILADNMDAFSAKKGMISIKARSEDVTAIPEEIFKASRNCLKERGFEIEDSRSLEPYEKSHEMIIVKR